MDAAYLDVNTLGFEGDTIFKNKMQELIDQNNVKVVVETGTFRGYTTLQLSKMVDNVYTIESNGEYHAQALDNFKGINNIGSYLGNSMNVLPLLLDLCNQIHAGENFLFFLDAHWESHNPLLEELKIIKDKGYKPIIVIHDFFVPDHPELGFDSYAGQDYNWAWIAESVEAIYGADGYTYFYNSDAEGLKRGVIFIQPK